MLKKLNLFRLAGLIILVLLMWKLMGPFLRKNHFLRLGLPFSSKLNWYSYIISMAKTTPKKIGDLTCSMRFLSLEVALYLYKPIIQPCLEYCCHVWIAAPSCCLEMLDKLQKWIGRTASSSLAACPEPLDHHQNNYYIGRCSSELAQLVSLSYSWGMSTRYTERLHNFWSHSHGKGKNNIMDLSFQNVIKWLKLCGSLRKKRSCKNNDKWRICERTMQFG